MHAKVSDWQVDLKSIALNFETGGIQMVKIFPMITMVNLVLTVKDLIWLMRKREIPSKYSFLLRNDFKMNHADVDG